MQKEGSSVCAKVEMAPDPLAPTHHDAVKTTEPGACIIEQTGAAASMVKAASIGNAAAVSAPGGLSDEEIADLIWRGRFTEAEIACGNGKTHDYRRAFRYAEAAFWKSALTGDRRVSQTALSRLEYAERIAENWRHKVTSSNERHCIDAVMAQVELLRAITQFSLQHYLKGAWTMRNAWKSFQSLPLPKPAPAHGAGHGHSHTSHHSRHPAPPLPAEVIYARRLGLGVFLYMFSMVPPSFSFIIKLIGFEGDRDKGVKLLESCLEPDAPPSFSRFATLVLAMDQAMAAFTATTEDPAAAAALQKADEMLSKPLSEEPELLVFSWTLSHIKRRERQIEEADELMLKVVSQVKEWEDPSAHVVAYRIRFDLGGLSIVKGDRAAAIEFLQQVVAEGSSFTAKAMVYTFLGSVYLAEGDHKMARQCYDRIPQVNEGGRMDKQLCVKARVLKRRRCDVLPVYEMGYIFQHFKYMAEDYLPKVLDDLEKGYTALCAEAEKPNIDRLAIHDDLATCALLKGAVLAAMTRDSEAREAFDEAIRRGAACRKFAHNYDRSHDYDTYHEPFAYYELSLLSAKAGDAAAAKRHLATAASFKDFTFAHSLEWRIKMARRHASH